MRCDLKCPRLPVVAAVISSLTKNDALPFVSEVREQQLLLQSDQQLATKLAPFVLVDTEDLKLKADNLHLDTSSAVALGKKMSHAFLSLSSSLKKETS